MRTERSSLSDERRYAEAPTCPRCGYALNGQIAAWTDQCPLDGTCAECGLEFAWGDLLTNRLHTPKWCIEFGRKRSIPLRLLGTLMMMCWPWKFWKDLKLEHAIRPARFLVFYLAAIMVLYVAMAGTVYVEHRFGELARSLQYVPAGLQPSISLADEVIYGLKILAMPWADTTSLDYTVNVVPFNYLSSPGEILTGMIKEFLFYVLAIGMLVHIGVMVASFCLLPASRRRARVQWRHIARIGMYQTAVPMAYMCLSCTAECADFVIFSLTPTYTEYYFIVDMIAYFLWVPFNAIWWSVAVGRYMRMPHGWAVGILLTILSTLLLPFCLVPILMIFDTPI
ncbi:MAG: hypothetical protein AAF432_05375 [Planctomycetota bacterium]